MKFKYKLLGFLTTILGLNTFSNLLVTNANTQTINNLNTKNDNENEISRNDVIKRTFDAKLIGAQEGTFNLYYREAAIGAKGVDYCTFVLEDENYFLLENCNFNFNGGKFTDNGVTYTITKIVWSYWDQNETPHNTGVHNINNVFLTIPSTIEEIGKEAFFYWGLRDIQFEEGLKSIGREAFRFIESPTNLLTNILVFPSTIEYIAPDAFYNTRINIWDLSHVFRQGVVETDFFCNYGISWNFCYDVYDKKTHEHHREQLQDAKIITHDSFIKNEYCSNKKYKAFLEFGIITTQYDGDVECEVKMPSYLINPNIKGNELFESTFSMKYKYRDNAKFTGFSKNQLFTGDFNFNNGSFKYGNFIFKITEIDNSVFCCTKAKYFDECTLTIPSTIKKIGDNAFNGCSRNVVWHHKEIRAIKFEEGIEDIGVKAFRKCKDIKNKTITLPNSLKHMSNDAFSQTSAEIFDLRALDHVIDVDCDVDSFDGCLPWSVEEIYVKSQEIKNKYLADKNWNKIAKEKMVVRTTLK